MELSITTTRSRQLRRTSLLALVFACLLSAPALAKQTPEEKAQAKKRRRLQKRPRKNRSCSRCSCPNLTWSCRRDPGAGIRCSMRRARGVGRRPLSAYGLVQSARRTGRRGLGPGARHAPHEARRRIAIPVQSRRHGRLHQPQLGNRHRRRRLWRREPHQRVRRLLAHRQHEGRADAVAVPGQLRRTATRPRPGSRTSCSRNGASRRSSSWVRASSIRNRARRSSCRPIAQIKPLTRARASAHIITRRFFVRADYRWHTIFTSRDDNEELEEWKIIIACFF